LIWQIVNDDDDDDDDDDEVCEQAPMFDFAHGRFQLQTAKQGAVPTLYGQTMFFMALAD